MKIFVYGTLMRGLQREAALFDSQFIGTGYIEGSLYNLGSYPGLKPGSNNVFGEVYEINTATLKCLDQIEGYRPDQPEQSLYIRKKVTVCMDTQAGSHIVETYFYHLSIAEPDRIITGDYRAFLDQSTVFF